MFLISHNADVFCVTPNTLDTCLHLACAHSSSTLSLDEAVSSGPFSSDDSLQDEIPLDDNNKMNQVGRMLLDKGLDPSKKNTDGL